MYAVQKLRKAVPLLLCFLSFGLNVEARPFSNSPRQTGEVVLEETVLGPKAFAVRVGSNGCTSKKSFGVSVRKESGVSERAPHYVLTINRKVPDECKAIVQDGAVIAYDLQKDLGISGNYTYTITNPVESSHPFAESHDSFLSAALKDAALPFPELKEVRPEPFEKFTVEHGFFSCLLPSDWTRSHDVPGDEKAGIYEVTLSKAGMAKPEDGEQYHFPEPMIYVGYYSTQNTAKKTYESYLADYDRLRLKNAGSARSAYKKPQKATIAGYASTITEYEVWQETPRGPLFTTRYWLKARFVIVRGREGFYVLALKSPKEFYDRCLPAFQAVVDSFVPKR